MSQNPVVEAQQVLAAPEEPPLDEFPPATVSDPLTVLRVALETLDREADEYAQRGADHRKAADRYDDMAVTARSRADDVRRTLALLEQQQATPPDAGAEPPTPRGGDSGPPGEPSDDAADQLPGSASGGEVVAGSPGPTGPNDTLVFPAPQQGEPDWDALAERAEAFAATPTEFWEDKRGEQA